MKLLLSSFVVSAACAVVAPASAVTLTFDELSEGTTLSTQYAALGAVFSPNAFSGIGPGAENWATNTDMTIVSLSGANVGAHGDAGPVSGMLLHSFNGWLDENGDASFRITFSGAGAASFSADFAGIFTPARVQVLAYHGSTLLGSSVASAAGYATLGFVAANITSVVITPGSFEDWVGVDNISFTLAPVPEPQTLLLMGLGLGAVALARRRSKAFGL